jgi:hypothetical protein
MYSMQLGIELAEEVGVAGKKGTARVARHEPVVNELGARNYSSTMLHPSFAPRTKGYDSVLGSA